MYNSNLLGSNYYGYYFSIQHTILLSSNDSYHNNIIDAITILQNYNIFINDSYHNQLVDSNLLTQIHNLFLDNNYHNNIIDLIVLLQKHNLISNDSYHENIINLHKTYSTKYRILGAITRDITSNTIARERGTNTIARPRTPRRL